HNVGPAFIDLENRFGLNTRGFESCGRTPRGEQPKAQRGKFLAKRGQLLFVAIVYAEKHGALARQALPRGKFLLGKSLTIRSRDSHDFALRTHLGTENG